MLTARTIKQKTWLITALVSLVMVAFSPSAYAQQSAAATKDVESAATLGVARMVEITGATNVPNGSLISASDKGPVLSSLAYDPQVMGVVSRDAAIILNNNGTTKGVPLISVGTVYIRVSSKDGPIKKGDLLTSSTMPGIAVKAVNSGYVLGTALEDYANPDTKKNDLIAADLDLHYFNSKPTFPGSLTDILKVALFPTKEAPTPLFKYIVAAAVVLGSFALTFLTFGRTAAKGIEALGRNPAASRIIHLGIIFNIGICIAIILAGLAVAFLILRL